MIKSMTGYGRVQEVVDGYEVIVEIRSVNHRYFEFSSRVPRSYGYLEDKLKSFIGSKVSRGKVDLYASIVPIESSDLKVQINHELARSYLEELRKLAEALGIKDDISLSQMASFSDIFILRKMSSEEDKIWDAVKAVTQKATEKFVDMRTVEGRSMKADVLYRLELIEKYTKAVENLSPLTVFEYRNRLHQRLTVVLEGHQIDEQRLLTEAAIFAEKTAVDEETVRLRSHIAQFYSILEENEAIGRKLDFLVQELNREVNTIGSKSQNIEIGRLVVEMKSEIEKIREQIQNIE